MKTASKDSTHEAEPRHKQNHPIYVTFRSSEAHFWGLKSEWQQEAMSRGGTCR